MADKLTNDLVESTPAPGKGAVTRWDNDPKAHGFGVRIFAPTQQNPAGVRSFFINYRIDGIERRHTIGKYPTWSASAARSEAQELRKRIDKGEDPASAKRERREAPTVGDLIDRYINDHLPKKAAADIEARRNDEIRMLNLIGDALDRRTKVADIHDGDVEAMQRQLTESRGPVRANRVLSIASKAFSLSLKRLPGENKPWRDAAAGNPCKGVERNPEEGKERFFSEAEIAALSDALAEHTTGSAADCIKFIMFTGCRPGEAMTATWAQMDVEPGYWVKRSAHTKQRKVHKVPLSPPALALLDKLRDARKRDNNPYLFPGQVPGESLKQIWGIWYAARDAATIALWASGSAEIAEIVFDLEAGLKRTPTIKECQALAEQRGIPLPAGLIDTRPYDLRHTFASVGAGGGLSLPIIGKLLGHTQARTTQRYAHLADDPLREATRTIGAVISGAGQPTAKILPIKG
jgi:integrase